MADESTSSNSSAEETDSADSQAPLDGSEPTPLPSGTPEISKSAIFILGTTLAVLLVLSCYWLYVLWPTALKDANGNVIPGWEKFISQSGEEISNEQRMLMLVMLGGFIGSLIHAATSFSNFVGERKLDKSWIWWYVLRPLIGVAVAIVFYLVFRAGLITNSSVETLNLYGVMTLAALSGLFTDRATLKLKEVFETIFKPNDQRGGGLHDSKDGKTNQDAS